jgi:hypothetical protein
VGDMIQKLYEEILKDDTLFERNGFILQFDSINESDMFYLQITDPDEIACLLLYFRETKDFEYTVLYETHWTHHVSKKYFSKRNEQVKKLINEIAQKIKTKENRLLITTGALKIKVINSKYHPIFDNDWEISL